MPPESFQILYMCGGTLFTAYSSICSDLERTHSSCTSDVTGMQVSDYISADDSPQKINMDCWLSVIKIKILLHD